MQAATNGRTVTAGMRKIEVATADGTWRQAVATAIAESLLERLNEQDASKLDAVEIAEREWAGKLRCCPKCSTEFSSIRDRGQCPSCGHIFYASHPALGNVMWWLHI